MRLAGKTALITGCRSGIGKASAVLFARERAAVAIASGSSLARAEEMAAAADGRPLPSGDRGRGGDAGPRLRA